MKIIHEDHTTHVAVAQVTGGHHHLVALKAFPSGARILHLDGEVLKHPSRYSLQIGEHSHICPSADKSEEELLTKYYWRYLNHSCEPNVMIRGRDVVAIRPILPMQDITFDYDATEYDMAEPFDCQCHTHSCRKRIRGFKHLETSARERLTAQLSPYLLRHLDVAVASAAE